MKKIDLKLPRKSHLLTLFLVVMYAALYWASAGPQKVAQAPAIRVPTYDYTPPEKLPAKSANVVFLLVDPAYPERFRYGKTKIFSDFSKAMSADFNEAMTAKGFSVRGPYEYYDQVVYSDKKESDLLLTIDIDLDLNDQNIKWHPWRYVVSGVGRNAVYDTHYTYDGFFVLSGKVNLVVSESITREKLWAKSIPLRQKEINIKTFYYHPTQSFQKGLTEDPDVMNPIIDVLENYYKEVLSTAWTHLDPSELTTLKKEVIEIRQRKVY